MPGNEGNSTARRDAMVAVGALPAIVCALNMHTDEASIQFNGLATLANIAHSASPSSTRRRDGLAVHADVPLSTTATARKDAIVAAGAAVAVVHAMQEHMLLVQIQDRGILLISSLAGEGEQTDGGLVTKAEIEAGGAQQEAIHRRADALLAAGAPEAVAKAMGSHLSVSSLQHNGLTALSNIAAGSSARAAAMGAAGIGVEGSVAQAIYMAMEAHPDDGDIARIANKAASAVLGDEAEGGPTAFSTEQQLRNMMLPFDEIRAGTPVKIRGLVSGVQYNGQAARIVSRKTPERYVVSFKDVAGSVFGAAQEMAIKRTCFTQMVSVELAGLPDAILNLPVGGEDTASDGGDGDNSGDSGGDEGGGSGSGNDDGSGGGNLTSGSRPLWIDGAACTIVDFHPGVALEYTVRMNAQSTLAPQRSDTACCEGAELRVPIGCVILPPGVCATVVGLVGAGEYNGLPAKVVEYDGESGRYRCQVGKSKFLKLKRSNVVVSAV